MKTPTPWPMLRKVRLGLLPMLLAIALQWGTLTFPNAEAASIALGVAIPLLAFSWLHEASAQTPRREAEGEPLEAGTIAARIALTSGVVAGGLPLFALFVGLGPEAALAFSLTSALAVTFLFLGRILTSSRRPS